jgi:hypothetical protein
VVPAAKDAIGSGERCSTRSIVDGDRDGDGDEAAEPNDQRAEGSSHHVFGCVGGMSKGDGED